MRDDTTDNTDWRQPPDLEPDLSEKLLKACTSFMEHSARHARYSDALEAEYAEIDTEEFEPKVRNAVRKNARERLGDDETLEPKPISMVLAVPPGVGKTFNMMKAFQEVRPGSVDLYMPTMALCVEFIEEHEVDTRLEMPRTGADLEFYRVDSSKFTDEDHEMVQQAIADKMPGGGYNCIRHNKANLISSSGLSPKAALCSKCDLAATCGYFRQLEPLTMAKEAGKMIIRTHQRLWSGSMIEQSRTVVIDESIIMSSIKDIGIPLIEFDPTRIAMISGKPDAIDGAEALCRFVHRFRADPHQPVDHMIQNIAEVKALRKAMAEQRANIEEHLAPHKLNARQLQAKVEQQAAKLLHDLEILCEQLEAAWKHKLPLSTCKIGEENLTLNYLENNCIRKDDNLLILDASYREWFVEILFPGRNFVQGIQGVSNIDLNIDVEVVDTTASKRLLVDQGKANDQRRILMEEIRGKIEGDTLLVANKKVVEKYISDGLPQGWEAANFGAIRGKNEWQDVKNVVLIGQSMPAADVVERQACAYAIKTGDRITTLDEHYELTGEKRPNGLLPTWPNGRYFHPCEIVFGMIGAHVLDEYIQAIGRCRAVRSETPKKVVIASKFIPPEIERYIVNDGRKSDFESLSSWHKVITQGLCKDGYVLLSPTFWAEKMELSKTALKSSKKRHSMEDDLHLLDSVMKSVLTLEHSRDASNCIDQHHRPSFNYLINNSHLELDLSGVEIGLCIYMKGGRSLYNNSIGTDPLPAQKMSILDVTWGRTRQPSKLVHFGLVPWNNIINEVPGLEPVNDVERGEQVSGSRKITLLRCRGETSAATKMFDYDGSDYTEMQSYGAGKFFDAYETEFSDLEGMAAKLSDLRSYPHHFVIRGQVKPGMMSKYIPRRTHDKGGEKSFLMDTPRSWVMMDIDNFDLPLGVDWEDYGADGLAQMMVRSLPEPFRSTSCYVQASASCGIKSKSVFKGHAWFILDTALTSKQIKKWLAHLGQRIEGKSNIYELQGCDVDLSVFSAVQPHYTADPIIQGGPDPLPDRGWLIQGETNTVEVDVEFINTRGKEYTPGRKHRTATPSLYALKSRLTQIGDSDLGFYAPMKSAAAVAAELFLAGKMSIEDGAEMISEAMREADPGDRSEDYIEVNSDPVKIENFIKWWLEVKQNDEDDD